ncbi:hypothetical protein [Candidatus Methanoperedens nitratireducens]|uniref:Lipoprotein n=1 Tax=Candidatus Methanoperedens nitratireducens TaxID=1392998 RepID=A0A284VPV6_9EURY|nr:hypothetical protein [Candidatus Methanoperedens nitroreducens]SNQ61314.1 hypothetical protein MNV_320001 [Candidatus Methanoperedens nitroreducens]
MKKSNVIVYWVIVFVSLLLAGCIFNEKPQQEEADKQIIAQMSLEWAVLDKNIPDYNQHIEKEHLPLRTQYNNQTYTTYEQCPLIDRGNDIIKDSGIRWNNRIIYIIETYLPNEIFIQNQITCRYFTLIK